MIKYFVSYSYKENGNTEFGWTMMESDHYFTDEQDLIEITQALRQRVGIERPIILSFQVMYIS